MNTRTQIRVSGLVQGVGFRPFVFLQATERALKGQVLNSSMGVLIDVEGKWEAIRQLIAHIESHPPPLSRVERIELRENLPPAHFMDFRIVASAADGEKALPVSADIATCDLCLREMFDPSNRRYRYPFINCTQCGPRFTIIEAMPYDRTRTTMRDFPMCAHCRAEYLNPLDRRFHAEATGCPECGPTLYLADATGRKRASGDGAVAATLSLLAAGKIVAIKGIGGFHLACDALNRSAVDLLRRRKQREEKPFALMARSVDMVQRFCSLSDAEKTLLESEWRPIVLLATDPEAWIPPSVAPGVTTLGFMLPYAPLHHLLFERLDRPLVMTSGNLCDEPIAYRDTDAVDRLGKIADSFLLHDRRIHLRTDDSVARVHAGTPLVTRRSRGCAPSTVVTGVCFEREILACGAHLKNTFCLCKERLAILSHHIGDLENFETLASFTEGIEHFKRLFDVDPHVVAYDLHPDYLSTRYALSLDDVVGIGVQHHHAHIASCMAEHDLAGPVIGVAFDGTGFGEDGGIWGGEFLIADLASYQRRAHLRSVPLPGGEAAIRQPWRTALSYLCDALGPEPRCLDLPGWESMDPKRLDRVRSMIKHDVNSPPTSSCGRLFDAVSSILDLRHQANYEGQAAIELEHIASRGIEDAYPFAIGESPVHEIDMRPAIRDIAADACGRTHPGIIAAKFHNTVALAIVETCRRLRESEGINQVCLSGGVFQNMILLEGALAGLKRHQFQVFHQIRVPTNDGGIAFGQAAVANERIRRGG